MIYKLKLSIILFCTLFSCIIAGCSKKDDNATKEQKLKDIQALKELHIREKQLEQKERELKLKNEQHLELAKLKAKEEAENAKLIEENLLQEAQEKEKKIAHEKERIKQLEIARRQQIQIAACNEFVNTKYEELLLIDGKKLKSAVVTAANPVTVSFIHQDGVANVGYLNLPKEIRVACMYDKELEEIELVNREELKRERSTSANSGYQAAFDPSKNNDSESSRSPIVRLEENSNAANLDKVAKPKGVLSVRVVASARGNKTIEVIAHSNVDAILYLNDFRYHNYTHQVSANQKYTHTWTNVNVKYDVRLEANGKVLDRESSRSKSGLGIKKGL